MREWWHNFRTSEEKEGRKRLAMWLLCVFWVVFYSRNYADMDFLDRMFIATSYWAGFVIFNAFSEVLGEQLIKKQPDKRVRRDF